MSGADLLWHGFTIVHVKDCIADPKRNRVMAEFTDDISAVFPYLNALMANAMYNPAASSMTVKRGERILTFYPHVAMMAKVEGAEDAVAQLAWFRDLCNETWQRREQITPLYTRRQLLGPLDVYRLLPALNCRECNRLTCMAFAFALLMEEQQLSACPRLAEEQYTEGGRRLAELLGTPTPPRGGG
jgi:ArsR family metal-binding transcriptional regulator